ncbi:arginine deiminase family protein [Clostridium sporogenes]|uniref:Arginine deiminase family protein n=1 Tax=Clostridium sporogenes TaxID=1509 RepID=A0AAE4FJX5_CLOSG|nr:arginine deiminase family protein [Clostridium sporogenes]MDS1002705.1 arginine deiminase family protein [Clostridium sporogenes]
MKSDIYVDFEYGKLKEVIIGIPYEVYGDPSTPSLRESFKYLSKTELEKVISRAGKSTKEIFEKKSRNKYELMEEENEKLINILKKFDIKIYRPKLLSKQLIKEKYGEDVLKSGYIQQYSRDPFVVIGNNIIELSTSTPVRRAEIFSYKEIFRYRIANSQGVKWISMPKVPSLEMDKNKDPMLEGGDIIVLGDTILVGTVQGNVKRSNEQGYIWLKNYLGNKYKVIQVHIKEGVLHLDCILSVPRKGLVILCSEALINGIPSYFKDWDIIDISLEESKGLCANGLPIDEENYILSYNDKYKNERIKLELESRGINVFMVYFENHNEDCGSIRCSCNPLLRKVEI